MTYEPLDDEDLNSGIGRHLYDYADKLEEQCRRANKLDAAVKALEDEWANPVPCHVMRKKLREDVFKAAAAYRGEADGST